MKKNEIKHQDKNPITGVLVINLGTPEQPTYRAVQSYLREFLSDTRVIELPKFLWQILLWTLILPLRPLSVAKKYAEVWLPEGSPLAVYSRGITQKIAEALPKTCLTKLGMRYGKPSLHSVLEEFKEQRISKLVVLPLYPQYSATTVGTAFDKVVDELKTWRFIPELHFISGYADFQPYIQALASSIKDYWKEHGRAEKLLLSFHGLPERNTIKGDPYLYDCQLTAQLLAKTLNLSDTDWQLVFQSRFGKAKWLQPYCSDALEELGKAGVKKIDVICPGFPADCLETLEEISISYNELFKSYGGEELRYIPALNFQDPHITCLTELIREQL